MSFFRKFFGTSDNNSNNDDQSNLNDLSNLSADERFILEFKKNGGKFIYCEDLNEVNENFLNILEENDWFECETLCFESKLFSLLDDNKLIYDKPNKPKFLLASCESLIADEGSILFSSNQIKQNKPNELPTNIVILAATSQIFDTKGDCLRGIKNKYNTQYPTNITAIKYFQENKKEDFLNYGILPKNLYLLLLEDQ